MSTTSGSFTIANKTGTLYIKIKYRLSGDSTWTSYNIPTSGTTYSFSGTNNRLYDIQVVNVNGSDNPASAIGQTIGFSDPSPTISPTNVSVGYTFDNLSSDIDTYTVVIATFDSPGVPLETHILPATDPVTDTFTGLTPLTKYYMTITPAANQFSETFTYTFTTEEVASCAQPASVTATLT